MDLQMQRAHGCAGAAEALVGRTFLWLRFFFSQKEMSSPSGEKQTKKWLKS